MLLWAIPGVLSPHVLFRVLVILFPCYLSIRPFWCVLSVPTFYSSFLSYASVCWYVLVHNSSYLLVEFSFVILESPILLVLFTSVLLSFTSPFFRQYLLIYLFKFFLSDLSTVSFCSFYFNLFLCFSPSLASCCCNFFLCPSFLISDPDFVFLFGSLGAHLFYPRLISFLHKLAGLIQWCYPRRHLLIYLSFRFLPWLFFPVLVLFIRDFLW